MKKSLLLSAAFVGMTSLMFAQGCVELFISEYVEGWGNNKAIELYNPTDEAKDLSNYRLDRYSNGSPNAADNQKLTLAGTIEAHSTFVIVIDKRDPEGEGNEQPVWLDLQAKADTFCSPVYSENNTMYFNGNDAMVLRNMSFGGNGFIIDVIGKAGQDPQGSSEFVEGWNDVPPTFTWQEGIESWTKDKTLIKKFEVEIGDLDPFDAFDPSVQYDSLPEVIINGDGILVGNWETLGWHDCACFPLSTDEEIKVNASVYPNPVSSDAVLQISSEILMTRLTVFDITGKTVFQTNVPNVKRHTLNLSHLDKGIYLINGTDGTKSFTKKIVKN
jgi:hypothetical protein